MKESYLFQKLEQERVKCQTCSHYCIISPGKRGLCGVRENKGGILYALNYEKVAALNIDPMEKKPFFHFLPGQNTLSLATVGCNMQCANCQNYELSQKYKNASELPGEKMSPEKIVDLALENNLSSISYTYVEPTIFLEYALDIMKIAKEKGLKNNWVSNGYLSPETIELISPYLDAINIDIKSFSEEFYQKNCGAKLAPVLETAQDLKDKGVWVEITTLVIPGLSDEEKTFAHIAEFIKNKLGKETPWHLSRFSGIISWKLQQLPDTSPKILEKAYQIGKEKGLQYVYTSHWRNTFCPACGELVVKRENEIVCYDKQGKCSQCNYIINL